MSRDRLVVALVSEVFYDADGRERLDSLLTEARRRGAELAVLPEIPLHAWSPATREMRREDAEAPLGTRHQQLAQAARAAGLALLGGSIVEEPRLGRRNRALLFARDGQLLTTYDKAHLPQEPGFWEQDHYGVGDTPPRPVEVDGFPVAIQLCSDLNRPEVSHALAAAGALAILGPRATDPGGWERWRLVLRATALTACCYVVSVTRPRPEGGVPLGGPSFVAAPDGTVALETHDDLALISLERGAVARARQGYPGYLAVRPELYRRAWEQATPAAAPAGDDSAGPAPEPVLVQPG
jgi:predicted amidohydrolase